jgi:hypothetical protein
MASKFLASANASVRKMAAPALSRLQQVTGGSAIPYAGGGEREAIKVSLQQDRAGQTDQGEGDEFELMINLFGLRSYSRILGSDLHRKGWFSANLVRSKLLPCSSD